ncbi:hypothetical protein SDC9_108834 [bioreactor metagenome]|uniref:SH3b domain-containing protein n=1 Tax=bioreactor metagenome TaxID=1076179 RepID=A0A645B933_9ZZZZ
MVINKRVLILAAILFGILALYGFLTLSGVSYQKSINERATAYITVVAPESIPTQDFSFLYITPTPTADPALGDLKGIAIGKYVQITGTEGAGLKIRVSAGTNSDVNFIASDAEAFQVLDGPVLKDDLVWWSLVTPYDQTRVGWAAANYLTLIDEQ